MAILTFEYNAHDPIINQMIDTLLCSGAKIIEPKEVSAEPEEVLDAYQKMFGKRKDNKYTDNEIFIFNSKLNASRAFAKYL